MGYVSNVDYPQDRWDLARTLMARAVRLAYFRGIKTRLTVAGLVLEWTNTGRYLFLSEQPGVTVSAEFNEDGTLFNVFINESMTERGIRDWQERLDRELLLDELAHAGAPRSDPS